ncbi:haloacid dehalogenase-like hydrolase [Alteromonas aestuariivivens]|uniref:Haloacid dehalogenase-like hydrolase n=1 Tax=Alteromonas aestuariivivens TaxID=1938339 RepID=A0A3D8M334_9ALTE|nr:HAD family hydrolase [Alteromonas aestuariivivens]RDV24038.1 haloacid dehalogenase-like hydrolase [Alteromonas aestuariivivens]
MLRKYTIFLLLMSGVFSCYSAPLPSWQDGESRQAIVSFVASVTDSSKPDFVPPEDRIAVFDNDGTLWSEQPMYFQLQYALDKLKERAKDDPSLLSSPVLKAAIEGDLKTALAGGVPALQEIINQSHANLSVSEFQREVRQWLNSAIHPTTGLRFYDMVYQPMQELVDYLESNDFTVYIVSGGGLHFLRAFAEQRYGLPPQQVVGSRGNVTYEVMDGTPIIVKTENVLFVDDGPGKPIGIDTHIGKKPIFAAGNSDGDYQMLQWTTSDSPSFGLLIHHTDEEREFAYDSPSHIGELKQGLQDAHANGWLVVDMKKDWKTVYPERP